MAKKSTKKIKTNVVLDGDVLERLHKVAKLAGTDFDTAANVILALEIVKSKEPKDDTDEVRIGFIDYTNYLYHIGEDMNPTEIYSSKELLLKASSCVKHCGIAKVEVRMIKHIPGKPERSKKKIK